MSNVLSEQKREQIVALGRIGWTLRHIEHATGVRRETASRYLKAAGVSVRAPGRWGHILPEGAVGGVIKAADGSKPAIEVSTDSGSGTGGGARAVRRGQISACEPHREQIEHWLDLGRNAMGIYQDLVDFHGFEAGYASVRRFVRKLRGGSGLEAHAVIETPPGQEAQVDYGQGPMVRHPETGKYRRTRLFVLTLGFSRKCVRLLVFKSSTRTWAELHERALRRLGGSVRVVVLDNLKEGVLKPDIYDPELNPLYADMLAHYGVTALPCRVRDPDRKGKVERGVGHAQETPLKGKRFESLDEAQSYLDHWEQRWADTRIHGTTKRQVAAMFAEEKPYLAPLPPEPFRYYQYGTRIVHLDGHIEVDRRYYSVPPGCVGCSLWVQWDQRVVRILQSRSGKLLREHRRQPQPGARSTTCQDRPVRVPKGVHDLLHRAERAGDDIGRLCHAICEHDAELGARRIQGVLSLARRFGLDNVKDACAAALECGVPTYRFVRRYIERRPPVQLTLRQVDPLIRQLTEYRDVINAITTTKEEESE